MTRIPTIYLTGLVVVVGDKNQTLCLPSKCTELFTNNHTNLYNNYRPRGHRISNSGSLAPFSFQFLLSALFQQNGRGDWI